MPLWRLYALWIQALEWGIPSRVMQFNCLCMVGTSVVPMMYKIFHWLMDTQVHVYKVQIKQAPFLTATVVSQECPIGAVVAYLASALC